MSRGCAGWKCMMMRGQGWEVYSYSNKHSLQPWCTEKHLSKHRILRGTQKGLFYRLYILKIIYNTILALKAHVFTHINRLVLCVFYLKGGLSMFVLPLFTRSSVEKNSHTALLIGNIHLTCVCAGIFLCVITSVSVCKCVWDCVCVMQAQQTLGPFA